MCRAALFFVLSLLELELEMPQMISYRWPISETCVDYRSQNWWNSDTGVRSLQLLKPLLPAVLELAHWGERIYWRNYFWYTYTSTRCRATQLTRYRTLWRQYGREDQPQREDRQVSRPLSSVF